MKQINITVRGIRPLIMHNGRLADPRDPISAQIASLTEKKPKSRTEEEKRRLDWLQWRGALYWDDERNCIAVPGENVEKYMAEGAAKIRKQKQIVAAAYIPEFMIPILLPEGIKAPASPEAMYADARFVFRKIVRIPPKTGGRQPIERVIIPTGWRLKFQVEFDDTEIDGKHIFKAIEQGFQWGGLGIWRPKFGRGIIEESNG